MAAFLLLKVEDIDDEELAAEREALNEFAGYRSRCNEILKVAPDPTAGKVSPTGIAYAPLDQPATFMDSLRHLERTLVLANTVAPEGARKVLMMNDAAAREIDVQEAEFTMFCSVTRSACSPAPSRGGSSPWGARSRATTPTTARTARPAGTCRPSRASAASRTATSAWARPSTTVRAREADATGGATPTA